jgi:hypothetical protein
MPPNPYRRQPNINDMMYPKGSKQPRQVWAAVMNVPQPSSGAAVTPTPTPTTTLTSTPTQTSTPTTTLTSTPTPSPTTTLTSTPTPSPTTTLTSTPTPTTTLTATQTGTPTSTPTPTNPFDADAVSFFNRVTAAGGTLTNTEKTAVNTLVLNMKSNNIWTLSKAVYPMVGGSAASCSQNLISSGFTGTFNGGWTISSTGVLGNGTNTYFNTTLSPSSELGLNSTHIAFYSRTNYYEPSTVLDIGSTSSLYILGWGINDDYHANNSLESNIGFAQPTNSLGFIINNRILSTEMSAWRAGTEYTDTTSSAAFSVSLPSPPVYLGAYNDGSGPNFFSNREYAFCSIGLGLSDVQASSYTTMIQTFQTTLSRQV